MRKAKKRVVALPPRRAQQKPKPDQLPEQSPGGKPEGHPPHPPHPHEPHVEPRIVEASFSMVAGDQAAEIEAAQSEAYLQALEEGVTDTKELIARKIAAKDRIMEKAAKAIQERHDAERAERERGNE